MQFVELFQSLHEAEVRYVLVGGLAVRMHGVDRSTLDIDLVLAMDDANLSRFIEMAKRLNFIPNIPVPMDALKSPEQIDQWHREKGMVVFSFHAPGADLNVIDVLVKPVVTFEELAADSTKAAFMGRTVMIASKRHLIRLKSDTGRLKDQQDIQVLSTMLASEEG